LPSHRAPQEISSIPAAPTMRVHAPAHRTPLQAPSDNAPSFENATDPRLAFDQKV